MRMVMYSFPIVKKNGALRSVNKPAAPGVLKTSRTMEVCHEKILNRCNGDDGVHGAGNGVAPTRSGRRQGMGYRWKNIDGHGGARGYFIGPAAAALL
jgi:hypothetical protein